MADVFVSYSRQDTEFVQRMASSLEERGRSVWIDTAAIADGEVFPQALRAAIEGADAFLFVITPDSVTSDFCEQEVTYARSLEKRMVPVLRAPVPDPQIPEEIRTRNWIPFTDADDFDASLERVVRALDTDLAARKEHTRWLVKALEWDGSDRDRSLLLRGNELKAAESWLARTSSESDPAPTTLQNEYVLAGRRAAAHRQRLLVAVSLVVAVVAVGLGIVALASRNQAVAAGNTARSQALAAESEDETSTDPLVSVLLARKAVEVAPVPQAVSALRQAVDASAARVALPTVPLGSCPALAGSLVAYSPSGARVAEGSCTGELTMVDAATGHIVYRRHLVAKDDLVAYDPDGRTLAVGTDSGVELLDAADGAVVAHLPGDVEPTDLAFSADGTQLAATTDLGVSVWDLPTGTSRQLVSDPNSDYSTLAFTSDGQDLVVGTDLGYTAVLDVDSGQVVHQLAAPGQSQATTTPSPVAVVGHELVVGENIVGGIGDVSADVDVWNTTTWTLTTVLTPVSGTSIASVDASPDGTTVAVGNDDGTGGIWSLSPDEELVPISGQTAYLNTLAFSPDSRDLAVVANDGTARIYRADGPWTTTVIADLCSCGNEMAWTSHRLVALNRDGNDLSVQAWLLPSGRPVPGARVLNTDQQDEGAVLSPDGRLAALLDDTTTDSTVTVVDTATGRTVFTLPSLDVAGVAFSPDGRLLAVGDASGGLHVTTLATGRTVVGHGWPTCDPGDGDDLVISADDREVAHSSFCGQVSIGSTATARPTETFDQHQQLSSVAFDPSGTHVAIASWASTTTVVDVATDTAVAELIGHTRGVTGVAYTPSGTYIVTTSNDDTVRVWSASTGQLLRVDHDQSGTGNPSVSPDGQVLAEDNNNDQIRLWTVCPDCADPSALLAASRSSVISPLTPLEREAVAQAG